MTLRIRLALAFAVVAILTAGIVALAAPQIVGRGFARMEAATGVDPAGGGAGQGAGAGNGHGPLAGIHAAQIQDDTSLAIVILALLAAAGASVVGVMIANRTVRPLERLASAAAGVAHGDLGRRSGLADRADELGSLGRSFDAMADELARAETSRRRFFADAAHELKTPLSVIDATTAALIDGVYAPDARHLQTIRDQSHLMGRIVDDLRTVSLAEASTLPLRPEPVDVVALLHAAAADVAVQAETGGVELVTVPATGVAVDASVDRDRIRQILAALTDNALRHTPPGGRVTLELTRPDPGTVRLAVRDTGSGVRDEDLPHLFDRFYQADPARDRATGTSGLGLAVVRALAVAHGGRAGAENAAGGGARFWVDLPVRATRSAGPGRPSTPRAFEVSS